MWDGSVWARKNLIYDPGALIHTGAALYLMFSLDLPCCADLHSGLYKQFFPALISFEVNSAWGHPIFPMLQAEGTNIPLLLPSHVQDVALSFIHFVAGGIFIHPVVQDLWGMDIEPLADIFMWKNHLMWKRYVKS